MVYLKTLPASLDSGLVVLRRPLFSAMEDTVLI